MIPDTINNVPIIQITDCAFLYSNISKIKILSKVIEIGEGCFENCFNLEKVKLSSSMDEIRDNTFVNCPRLSDVSIKYISEKAFDNCPLLEGKIKFGYIN